MFVEGIIKNYNTERGFGFIELIGEKKDIFFHITDVPHRHIELKSGERLKFLIVEDKGKFKATNIVRLDLKLLDSVDTPVANKAFKNSVSQGHSRSDPKKATIITLTGLIIVVILAGLVFQKYQSYQQSQRIKAAQLIEEQKKIVIAQRQALGDLPEIKLSEKTEQVLDVPSTPHHKMQAEQPVKAQAQFSCDGRKHCSQMHSREEAIFFLKNCPNTKMDGDSDGIPCENDSRW
ncbi:MAG: cold shock domain-containing protein [Moraxellaceae bacterium]|nr:cold shock domain-containing protein [Moraxellaceae bacterium]